MTSGVRWIPTGCLALAWLAFWGGCSTSPDDVEEDGEAPAVITDLQVVAFDAHSVTLNWTATGDDGLAGTAAVHDLRYLPRPLDWLNWEEAVSVAGEPQPLPAGTVQSMVVASLQTDTTYFFGLEVRDEAGNCQGLSNIASQVCFDNVSVEIPDPNLAAALREFLAKPAGDFLKAELLQVREFSAANRGIQNLTGLEACANLGHLDLAGNLIQDLGPLADLSELWHLHLPDNQLADLGPLAGLTSLTQLLLGGNRVTDLGPLAGLTSMTNLILDRNQIKDLAPVADLVLLQELNLENNAVTDLSPLQGLAELATLRLSTNEVTGIKPLGGLVGLRELRLGFNDLGDIGDLAMLSGLVHLSLDYCGISDLGPLEGLVSLEHLSLSGNPVVDFDPLGHLASLRSLALIGTGIADLAPLRDLTNLEYIHLYNNQVVDIGPLVRNTGLGEGDQVNLQFNPLSDWAREKDIPALRARGVAVTY